MSEKRRKPSDIIFEKTQRSQSLSQELEREAKKFKMNPNLFLWFLDEVHEDILILSSELEILSETSLPNGEKEQTLLINDRIFQKVIDVEGYTKSLELVEKT